MKFWVLRKNKKQLKKIGCKKYRMKNIFSLNTFLITYNLRPREIDLGPMDTSCNIAEPCILGTLNGYYFKYTSLF